LDRELRSHLALIEDEYVRRGLGPEAARRAAQRALGGAAQVKDRQRDARSVRWLDDVRRDVRYALRTLRRTPGFTTVVLLTLGVGIGATTALFGVMDAAIIQPLPYPHPEQLVHVSLVDPSRPARTMAASLADLDLWQRSSRSLSFVGTFRGTNVVVTDGEPERLDAEMVTAEYLQVYGARPVRGRFFNAEDERPDAPPVVLLGSRYWRRHFNGDPSVVGRTIRFATGPATIVGIVPDTLLAATAIWRPLQATAVERRQRQYNVTARLRDGVTLRQAQAEINGLAEPVAADGPGGFKRIQLTSLYDRTVASYRSTVGVLAGAVGFVLLIACINVASLQLARGATREVELAIRMSIGAGRARLVRGLLIESVILSLAGAALGAGVAKLIFDALLANIPIRMPADVTPAIDLRVLGFILLLAVVVGVAFGLAPALKLSRVAPARALNASMRGIRASLSKRAGALLVAVELASAVILLAGSALMIRSFQRLSALDLGFRPADVLTVEVEPVDPSAAAYEAYYPALVDRLSALPNIAAVGATDQLPLDGRISFGDALTDGPSGDTSQVVDATRVLPGYFQAIGLDLLAGRALERRDLSSGAPVAVLSDLAAHRLFPGIAPVGHRLQFGKSWYDIVGVVSNVSIDEVYGFSDATPPQVYLPYTTRGATSITTRTGTPLVVVVRPRGDATGVPALLRETALAVGPQAIVRRVRSGRDWWSSIVTEPRQRTFLIGLLGGIGLLLALVGVFGVTSFAVARRTSEIGVRLALGARPRQVVGEMVRDALLPIGAGVLGGLVSAAFATRLIATFLFHTTPRDPVTFFVVAIALTATGCLAAWLPARRAARVDPLIALRRE
jgi:predicted permease